MGTLKAPVASPDIYAGLVGEVVDTFSPFTEAAPVAIAAQFLAGFGNVVGRGPHFLVGETRHAMNEYLLITGLTSQARKGDGANSALRALKLADTEWAQNIKSGFSSGEGLIYAVRDELWGVDRTGDEVRIDKGVEDKRLLVAETEFSQALKMFRREGNTLSNVMRDGWDGKPNLGTLTKNSPITATDAHISIIGHTTPEDLRTYLSEVEIANGLGNRFLFALVHRAKLLPNPGRVSRKVLDPLVHRVQEAVAFAREVGRIKRSDQAADVWEKVYPKLEAGRPGLLGPLLARGAAHVTRLSALYALSTQASAVTTAHQRSALAFWKYCTDSAEAIFEDRTGNDVADRIKMELLPGQPMTVSEIRKDIFFNHVTAGRLRDALKLLEDLGDIAVKKITTGGRTALQVRRLGSPKSAVGSQKGAA